MWIIVSTTNLRCHSEIQRILLYSRNDVHSKKYRRKCHYFDMDFATVAYNRRLVGYNSPLANHDYKDTERELSIRRVCSRGMVDICYSRVQSIPGDS